MSLLEEELTFFQKNQYRLAKLYPNSFLVIKGQRVYGDFPSILEAYTSALNTFEIGTFLVIKIIPQIRTGYKQSLPAKAFQSSLSWWMHKLYPLRRSF
ncbi:hypothetical protein AHMF7605_26920 [Adhaeribacter arboris]|uniref:DUF5678 domain-containing protein n=1 Tax=Adhaeribacter arboris TaxID=2072846 RepID=A0A2T2YMX8_9BACT|nr:hypothetical protein [Adhaeribacter arboris]PSR56872.1 hypothetical protein AHMF7605_26920 [Adhaeribacter arboris]